MTEILTYRLIQHEFNDAARSSIGHLVYSFPNDPTFVFLLLDFYEYSLLDILNVVKVGLPLRAIHPAIRRLSAVLTEMDRLGLRHTDIKPENIMVNGSDDFKLVDFGGTCRRAQPVGSYVQTRWYRAPEVALGSQPTSAADVWSLGAVLAEMYLGQPVFAGESGISYLRLVEMRVGPFPVGLIAGASAECRAMFENGRVKGGGTEINDRSTLMNYPLRRLLEATSFEGDPEDAKKEFIDLVMNMLAPEPGVRLTAVEIGDHPFVQMVLPPT
jgi:serine/threonine protein kinase